MAAGHRRGWFLVGGLVLVRVGVFPDVGVFPVVVGRDHEWVRGLVVRDRVEEWFDDLWWVLVVGVA